MSRRVLWHLSHHSSSQPDGWSGAPDEARWVREDLTPRVRIRLWSLGITMIVVNGDGSPTNAGDHIEFHQDYDIFAAPHYDANIYNGVGGWFSDRAATSLSATEDDRFGAIFDRRYRELCAHTNGPAERTERRNANTSGYYGFRLTTARTPGRIVEHGVGAPGAPDHDWLRANIDAIADVWALAITEFMGLEVHMATPTRIGQSAASVELTPGGHAVLQAVYQYEPEPSGEIRARTIVRKVTGLLPGTHFFEIRPPVDPDDDESIDLDAEPAKFLVVVLKQP